jgi:HPt (histidine-containing phosphotransfer) domain-containing protein
MKDILEWAYKHWPEELEKLADMIDEKNEIEETRRRAHTIKGASANVGAETIKKLAAKIEEAEDFETMKTFVPEIMNQFELFKEAIAEEI